MTNDRPTFHEAWYRVAELRPRLLSSVNVYRQNFRGQLWYVLENSSNNKYSRISDTAYQFIGMLDGKNTIDRLWKKCTDKLGENAPTQGEVIQLLGQLYCSNLLYAEIAPDTASLFNRYQDRLHRQVKSYLVNMLFLRIPLFDPEPFLQKWVGMIGKIFSFVGFLIWLITVIAGLCFAVSNSDELIRQSSDVLAPSNLILLYISMVLIKLIHEFGHAFACKKFGQLNGSGGQVHTMGVMFVAFIPLPYVDTSSSWAFRKKNHRAIVGMAGVLVELFLAAVAVIVWANTSTGATHIIAYNVIFIAGVSTLVFNGNPLMRFDAYYVVSDLLEIPNLAQRSQAYVRYFIKKYCWKVRSLTSPAHNSSETAWLASYGVGSLIYRVLVSVKILYFLNDRLPEELFILVPILATLSICAWVLAPLGKFINYMASNSELSRSRTHAICTTLGILALLVICTGILPLPDYCRVEGVVEPVDMAIVHAQADGFLVDYLPTGTSVSPDSAPIVTMVNNQLRSDRKAMQAELTSLNIKHRLAITEEISNAQIISQQINALNEKIATLDQKIESLQVHPEKQGTWVSPGIDDARGGYLDRGEQLGFVADLSNVIVRATAGQNLAAVLVDNPHNQLDIRVKGRPDIEVAGKIEKIYPAGHEVLPSQALGYDAGGAMATQSQDPQGRKTSEKFFEVRIKPDSENSSDLLTGQRVVARIKLESKPLAFQWWMSIRQLFQRRFYI